MLMYYCEKQKKTKEMKKKDKYKKFLYKRKTKKKCHN